MAAELQIFLFFPLIYLLKTLEVMTHANVEEILKPLNGCAAWRCVYGRVWLSCYYIARQWVPWQDIEQKELLQLTQ